ncbi:MAG: rod shape-determining protein MreC [Bacteroides sp.]|nr:rod shape-determining protein MreC [Bacteroides sp.]
MRNLLNFLIRYNYWFLFILLEVICFGLLFRFNNYQKGIYFSSANFLAGKFYEVSGGITSYFHLKSINEELIDRNLLLEEQVTKLENTLRELQLDSSYVSNIEKSSFAGLFTIRKAHVINNSIAMANNYITLNKGTSDGIFPEMGVIDGRGVVGIVYVASPSYSVVISLLNGKSKLSCKIKGNPYSGYLKWEYGDARYAYLKDIPRYAEMNVGDTIITNGHSAVFPEGVMVGTISNIEDSSDGLSSQIQVELAADFGRLSDVRVLSRDGQKEQLELEKMSME